MANPPEQHKPLTTKQEAFVLAYIGEARFNASEAARIAGYSEKSAARIGFDLKKTPSIRARIDELLEAETLTSTEILRELTDVGMRDLGEFVEISRWNRDGEPIAARMDASAKMKSLELLGKAHQLFVDRKEITGANGGPLQIASIEVVLDDVASDGDA